jgi:hypothetical protein
MGVMLMPKTVDDCKGKTPANSEAKLPDRLQASPGVDRAMVLHGFRRQGHIPEVDLRTMHTEGERNLGPVYYCTAQYMHQHQLK